MSAARVPLAYRDSCAHLLIPLNRCRFDNYFVPWACTVREPPPGRRGGGATSPSEADVMWCSAGS